jgi:hypothetical protein
VIILGAFVGPGFPSCAKWSKSCVLQATYLTLDLVMKKKKPGIFSATKAVKANARERVGQPKPARVLDTEPRTGRAAKHKPKLDEILREHE